MNRYFTKRGFIKLFQKAKYRISIFVVFMMCINLCGIITNAESDNNDKMMSEAKTIQMMRLIMGNIQIRNQCRIMKWD